MANLVAVKVLDADGSGTTSGVISGIQWVANNAPASSVLSMSLSGSYSAALNSAVAATVSAGVTVLLTTPNFFSLRLHRMLTKSSGGSSSRK